MMLKTETVLSISLPGDKSISHRALMFAACASGTSVLRGLPDSDDVRRTASGLSTLGANLVVDGATVRVEGGTKWRSPPAPIDCGNSGTSARLFAGMIAGLGVSATLDGDRSLRHRPMDRIVYPLQAMGARVRYQGVADRLPVEFASRSTGTLRPLRHRARVASAQVKTGLVFAGLLSRTRVEVREPVRSRDHTERMLRWMGAPVRFGPDGEGWSVGFDPDGWDGQLAPLEMAIPGDPSSSAFMVVAALFADRPVCIRNVCLNPTRTGYVEVLRQAGVEIDVTQSSMPGPEPTGDIVVRPTSLRGFRLEGAAVTSAIDEVPILAVAASRADGITEIRDAAELRVKESDRLALLASNFERIGVRCEEQEDGLRIHGTAGHLSGRIETGGDHRIAMAFSVLGAFPGADIEIDDPGCARVSYPSFHDDLRQLVDSPGES